MDIFFGFIKVVFFFIIGSIFIKYKTAISKDIYKSSSFHPSFKTLERIIVFGGLLLIIASIMGLFELLGKLLK